MSGSRARQRPKIYPPPEFPPRRPKLFARTPPVVFSVILGLLGLVLALGAGLRALALPTDVANLAAGLVVPLWGFAVLAYVVKLFRRPGTLLEDLRVLPARGGIAAATMGGMAAAAVLVPIAPGLAWGLLVASLVAHGLHVVALTFLLYRLPPEAGALNPTCHMSLVGPIVGAAAAVGLGADRLADVLFLATLPIAAVIWAISALRLWSDQPPAPLRPLLAIHLAPAGLLAGVAVLLGLDGIADGMLLLASVIAIALLVRLPWLLASGRSPLWGSFTFPVSAFAGAMLTAGGPWTAPGLVMLAVALVVVPALAWQVLKEWPGGTLAARTNAAEA